MCHAQSGLTKIRLCLKYSAISFQQNLQWYRKVTHAPRIAEIHVSKPKGLSTKRMKMTENVMTVF